MRKECETKLHNAAAAIAEHFETRQVKTLLWPYRRLKNTASNDASITSHTFVYGQKNPN